MKMGQLLLAAAILVSLVVSGRSSFDFYKLSLQWPPSTCSGRIECIPKNFFTIHGLWPEKFKGSKKDDDEPVPPYKKTTTKCTDTTPMNPENIMVELQPIKKKLEENWPNLYLKKGKRDDLTFWKHEWKNHGMYSDYPNDPRAYFSNTLDLFDKYNPLEVMGIRPNSDSVHKVKVIVQAIAIHEKWGKKPQIACKEVTNSKTKRKTKLLWEIRLCFERDPNELVNSFVLRDCPRTVAKHCNSEENEIIFPDSPISSPKIMNNNMCLRSDYPSYKRIYR